MARVVLALGSNLGDRKRSLTCAVSALSNLPDTHILKRSEWYETQPIDVPEPFADLLFLNGAVLIETALSPLALLEEVLAIESRAGRVRTVRNGPRPVDIDVILYEGVRLTSERLMLPHPRAHLRDFVLRPLRDLGFTRENVCTNTFPDE